MSITFVRAFINTLPVGKLFTTRDCLRFGRRAAIDQALARLVRSQYILRLARGVFMRDLPVASTPSSYDIAETKARAFGKQIASYGADLAAQLGLIDRKPAQPTYIINGHTSSFQAGGTTIHLHGACMRKLLPRETLAGQVMRALWHLGRQLCTPRAVMIATARCGRSDRQALRDYIAWMPSWLGDYFAPRTVSLRRR